MKRQLFFLAVAFVCMSGQVCGVRVNVNTGTTLDDANAIVTIRRTAGQPQASVEASFTRGFANVNLTDEQSITINGEDLNRTGSTFFASIDANSIYTLVVREPTRGVESTAVTEPGDFEITSPPANGTASLSGFTIEWTNADPSLQVEVRIAQTLLGEPKFLSIGPVGDTGAVTITDEQIAIAGFGQGAQLTLTVTRLNETSDVNGFASGVMQVRLAKSTTANAGP
ncbi:MAG: hypothetical protein H6818_07600 [Phycisphaerales bacterium]|nr:hypothetical protein [Phycisphaerales bacterium]MCB9864189.1 hypothetical protein [Phycisphaerales bacterium]